jgi:hypothetical protein
MQAISVSTISLVCSLSKLVGTVTFVTYIQVMLGLHLGRDTDYEDWHFVGFLNLSRKAPG